MVILIMRRFVSRGHGRADLGRRERRDVNQLELRRRIAEQAKHVVEGVKQMTAVIDGMADVLEGV